MVFSSPVFIFLFLPLTILLYYIVPSKFLQAKNGILLIASLIFYAWGEPKNILLMLISIAANYIFGIMMGKYKENKRIRKVWLTLSVTFNLGMLFYFKYFNFFTGGRFTYVILPIGISFFTFQIMSYVIDVYRDQVGVQKNIFLLALYISFFPQLIAGPIVRYIDIEEQLANRSVNLESFSSGIYRFARGFAKKILISNTVALLADTIFGMTEGLTGFAAWIGIIAYSLQIYYDFSGYSDMAIGLGRMFGFEFLENFNYPYISISVQDFWRRWHMSLSTWFRDYLYIPLGGNRKGNARTYINLIIVFACTGFWHGAAFTFIVWGMYHGLFLIIERSKAGKLIRSLPKTVGSVYTLLIVIIGWVIFRADTLTIAFQYISTMFNFANFNFAFGASLVDRLTFITLISGIVLAVPIVPAIEKLMLKLKAGDIIVQASSAVLSIAMIIVSVLFLTGSDYNPFIYFRF